MKQNETIKVPKYPTFFDCCICHYSTSRKSQYDRHLLTDKHKNSINETKVKQEHAEKYNCICGIVCKGRTTLWRHKKTCSYTEYTKKELQQKTNDKELIMMLVKQNSELLEVIKNGTNNNTTNNSNNTTTNSHNKSFNLNFFLNETCKDAMNIMEFVDSIKLQLSDLENVGKIGYVEGISNIIVKNLNDLDVTERPIHCTDKKRETLYNKDEDKWEKEDEEKKKIKKVIKHVANKNIRLIQKFKEVHPDCSKSTSKFSDQYDKIIVEAMGGSGNNDSEKEEKIIQKIAKNVTIDKEV